MVFHWYKFNQWAVLAKSKLSFVTILSSISRRRPCLSNFMTVLILSKILRKYQTEPEDEKDN